MTAQTSPTEQLARAFSSELRSELGDDIVTEIVELNAASDNADGCYSHDYCDANMVMEAAFIEVFGREPDVSGGDDVRLWNAAWNNAVEHGFYQSAPCAPSKLSERSRLNLGGGERRAETPWRF